VGYHPPCFGCFSQSEIFYRIRNARVHAALSVNRELILLYWQIGQVILERQAQDGWGAKVIERLADDRRDAALAAPAYAARNETDDASEYMKGD
jgi:hypothetical protein